eukprot:Tbor_TRINITY_DN5844_c1_g2::TRINITY_DN5844_c1_g2_i1::g.6772::m.6772/K14860/TMA16; translation machinery-associated protein 16
MNNGKLLRHNLKTITHPKDRKIDQLQKRMRHNTKIDVSKDKRRAMDSLTTTRVFWFRVQCEKFKTHPDSFFTPELQEAMIIQHIKRNEKEIALLKMEKRPMRGRIDMLEAQQEEEASLFVRKGLAVPDITCSDVREILCDIWDGDSALVSCVPLKTFKKKHLEIKNLTKVLEENTVPIDQVREREEVDGCSSGLKRRLKNEVPLKVKEALRVKSAKASIPVQEVHAQWIQKSVCASKQRVKIKRHMALTRSRNLTKL